MRIRDDPYAILGVASDASPAEVKKAYRRLAMRWHPDRNASATAEAEFKRIHAAYELFLDPQRLAEWRQAHAASAPTDGRPAASSGKASAERPGGRAGDDLTQSLTLTLEEAALGCRKTVDLGQRVGCASCARSGRVQHRNSIPCQGCSGCGRVGRGGAGGTSICPGCGGRGYLRESACPACAGSGWLERSRTLAVTVPPGLLDGERLRLAGQAPLPPGDEERAAGDLYLEISFAKHPLFVLHGRDVHCQVPVSIYRLLCGGGIEVPSLRGTSTLELSPYPQHPLEYRLPGQGFPGQGRRAAGDLVLQLQRVYPTGVGASDVELFEQLEGRLAADLEQRAPPLAAWQKQLRARRQPG
ncbi:DnaJ C-terminal domain-containing protein [Candidatus Accumulibacter sp. ACC003]|uniref:DnaJ C-terminal domain-containing protein n=1 Tax=Candidatus Accumulibacter sp. ACC003 TaxID=2823334 RepID=UPI0025BFF896|nr:DnaJ C-terminal domain-containing protein [Candidatus Accumulibacter sp. ACC003]